MTGKKKRNKNSDATDFEISSGNVFADLGRPDAEERLLKSKLAIEICDVITRRRLSQKQAAARLQTDQPKISALMRGRLEEFSIDRLLRFLIAIGQDIEVTIRPAKDPGHATVRVRQIPARAA